MPAEQHCRRGIEIANGAMLVHSPPERVGDGHRVAAEAECHRHDGPSGEWCQAKVAGDRHRTQHVSDVEMTDSQTVPDVCPGAFADQGKLDAFGLSETHLLCRDQ